MKTRRRRLPRYVQARNGSFRGWWMEGGRRRYTSRFDSPEQAHAEAMRQRGIVAKPVRPTLDDGINLVRRSLSLNGRRPQTVSFYEGQFRASLSVFQGDSMLDAFRWEHIEFFIERRLRKVSASTVGHNLRALSRIFNVAIRQGLLDSNPVKQVERPSPKPAEHDVFEWEDAVGILETLRVLRCMPSDVRERFRLHVPWQRVWISH